ncbi:MAG: zinc-ribbon domain-containing protein [Clostridia bacterium]|nr:zinc-ribbon domain-containing protein [Clostridia bacterium]MDE7215596.1 zinc-ribbon domain-containing protein [Clostridia bacterium]
MKKCPKCGKAIDDEMVICPSCGERLQDSKLQNTEFISIHLIRWLLLISIIIPVVGFIISLSLKNKYPLVSKMITKFSTFGVALLAMLFLLGAICYIAMTLSGVSFL